jgi:hypothetical protein
MAAKDPCIAVAIAVAFLAIIPAGDLLLLLQLLFLFSSSARLTSEKLSSPTIAKPRANRAKSHGV